MTTDINRVLQLERQIDFIQTALKKKSYMGCGIVLDLHIGMPNYDEPTNPMRHLSNIDLGQGEDVILAAIEAALVATLRERLSMLKSDHAKTTEFLNKRAES